MANFLEYVNLSRYSLYVTLVLNSVLFEYLDGDLLSRDRVRSNSDLTESSRAQRPAYKHSFTDIR